MSYKCNTFPQPDGINVFLDNCGIINNKISGSREMQLTLCPEGEGGTYFVKVGPDTVAVFKPKDEEMGGAANPKGHTDPKQMPKRGVNPGEGYLREVVAFQLDVSGPSPAGVPEAHIALCENKVGSWHTFVNDVVAQSWDVTPARFSVDDVHRIGLFDLRTLNTDRHGGNMLLVRRGEKEVLVPIDHTHILTHDATELELEWLYWPQSKVPFAPHILHAVAHLDPKADEKIVKGTLGNDEDALTKLRVGTTIVQTAALRGYTLFEIGSFCRRPFANTPSGLERALAVCSNWTSCVEIIENAFPERECAK